MSADLQRHPLSAAFGDMPKDEFDEQSGRKMTPAEFVVARAKVSPATVGTVRRELEAGVQIEHHAQRIGRDGKKQAKPAATAKRASDARAARRRAATEGAAS